MKEPLYLPRYIVADIKNLKAVKNSTLRQTAKPFDFPLTDEDKKDIKTVVFKYESEEEKGGLAAPQIGISKRIIVFEVPELFEGEKSFPKSVWINPSYEIINDEVEEDYEECVSLKDIMGLVKRYKKISFRAYDLEGKIVEGVAEGITARVIQHEIDHLNGVLFTDLARKESFMTQETCTHLLNSLEEGFKKNFK